jgi:molybdate transport system substrate-binding protein
LKKVLELFLAGMIFLISLQGCTPQEKAITAFCGSASKPAMEEAAEAFKEETGITVYLNFGGSGTVLSQMKVANTGDVYIPGSPDYMVIAEKDGVVDPSSIRIISYLVPAILVQEGNPANIQALIDLARPGIEVGIGNPESVCVGLYAYELFEYNGLLAEIEPNIVTHAESCSKTATLVALKSVDAILGWRVFASWHDTVEAVYLEPQEIPRLAYIPGAVSTYAEDRESAEKFLDFLVSPGGQEIFKKWGYLATESEAREFAPDAEIGGEYRLPGTYRPLIQ